MARENLYRLGAALQAAPVLGLEAFRNTPTGGPEPTPVSIPGAQPFHLDADQIKDLGIKFVFVVAIIGTIGLLIANARLGRKNRELYGNTDFILESLKKAATWRRGRRRDEQE